MAKLVCTGAQKCAHKRNAQGIMCCGKFTEKSQCIHARTVDEIRAKIEEVV